MDIQGGGYFTDFGKQFSHSNQTIFSYFSSQYCNDQKRHLELNLVKIVFKISNLGTP